jgi:CRP/FNR family cyclic AMP-dependent transcriptional regulator
VSVAEELEETAGIMLAEHEALVRKMPGVLDALGADDRLRLLSIGQKFIFEADQPLFRQDDPHRGIHLIESGRIRSYYVAPSGREVTLAYWFPGNFVGAPNMFGGDSHMWTSSAVQRTITIFLPGPALRHLALDSAAIAVALLDALAFKARCYSAMAQMLGTRSATERLHHLLAFLAMVYGIKERDGTVIAASFTHADLANLIGSTRQWVTVQLSRLQERGIIQYNRGLLVIRDPGSLATKPRA